MRWTIMALAFIGGCDFFAGDESAPVEVVVEQKADTAAPPAEAAVPLAPPRSAIDKARDLAVGGDYAGAVGAARALITENAKNDDAWRLLKYAAVQSGEAASVAGDLPGGTRAGVLKAELLLAAKDAVGAMTAAKGLLGERPDVASTLMARAAMLGADAGEVTGKAAAIIGFATAPDARRARPFAEESEQITGWRAALLRAELAEARDEIPVAFAAYKSVVEADKAEAVFAGNLGRFSLAKKAKDNPARRAKTAPKRSNKRLAKWIQAAHDVAIAEGWSDGLVKLTRQTVAGQLMAEHPKKAVEAANATIERLTVAGAEAGAPLYLAKASALLESGEVVAAASAAETARAAFEAASKPKKAAQASWLVGQAAYALGQQTALDAAAAQALGAQKDALKAMSLVMQGRMQAARLQFPTKGLQPIDGARTYVEAARTGSKHAREWLEKAVKAANKSGRLSAKIYTRLALESLIRDRSVRGAARLRSELASLAVEGTAGDALRSELAARAVLAGEKAYFPAGESRLGLVSAWEALAQRRAPAKAKGEAEKGLVQWARGRAAAARKNLEGHDAHFSVALGKLPLHRQGPLDPITVLDGSEGVDVDTDLALLGQISSETAVSMALHAHDIGHRIGTLDRELQLGRQLFATLSDELRETLLAANARVRAGTLVWLSGAGSYPTDAFTALAEAEAAAVAADQAFSSIMPGPGAGLRDFIGRLGTAAVLSLRVSNGKVHGVALSRIGNGMRELGNAKDIRSLVDKYYAALDIAAAQRKKVDHSSGDALRRKLIDPFIGDLVGVGRYVIVGPPSLTPFSYTVLPEQAEGLRWLADIRQMTTAPTIASLNRSLRSVDQSTFKLDFLGFGVDAGKASDEVLSEYEIPDELKTCSRHFQSGFDETLTGENSTVAAWGEKSEFARYVHLAGVPAAERGGFQLADGVLSLEQIRNTPMHAELVVISAKTTRAQQMNRARAFLVAGAKWVLVTTWDIPDRTRVSYLSNIYESMNHERPPVRALNEGRKSLFRDSLIGVDMDDPSLWGGLQLFGMP